MLHQIANRKRVSQAAKNLVEEIGRQAIICPSSMMAREIGHKGFHVAPVLSQALFGEWFINSHYQPLSGLDYRDFTDLGRDTLDRLMHGLRSTLASVLNAHDYWQDRSLATMEDHLELAALDVHRQVRVDRRKYEILMSMSSGLKKLIRDVIAHLNGIDPKTYDLLYVYEKRHENVLDHLAETILKVICSFANDFDGHEDVFWTTAIDIVDEIFPKFTAQPDGMNPLQQRVAVKFIEKVRENMDGYYPALTRVLLPVIGPYGEHVSDNPNSAFSLLRQAFYAELVRFPQLYEKKPERATQYLPKNVQYDTEYGALVQIYRGGEERSTELRGLSIEPVSFHKIPRKSNRPTR
jgi:hypothetical protein